MSYTNGIGSAQLLLTAVSTASTTAASAASRTQPSDADGVGSVGGFDDHTTFSTTSNMVAQASSGSDVRMEKVTALQQAIAAGTYNIPASDVADKLMKALSS